MAEPLEQIEKFTEGWTSKEAFSPFQVEAGAALDILNVEYHPRGAISKREGYTSYNMSSTPISCAMHIFPWKDISGNDVTLVFTSTSGTGGNTISADVYSIALTASSTTQVTAQKLLSAESYTNRSVWWNPTISANEIHAVAYGGSAIAVWGGSEDVWGAPPLVVSAGNTAAVPATAFAYSGAKYVEAWGNYLFMANLVDSGERARSRVRWNLGAGSVWLGSTSWPASYYMDLDADDGDEITGMRLLKDFLVVFKRNKIFLIWYTGDSTIFTYRRQSADIGCIAGNTIIAKGEYLYFLGDKGFYRFDAEAPSEISQKIKDKVVDDISHSLTPMYKAATYDDHRQLWFSVNYTPFDAAAENSDYTRQNNAIFVYDYELKNWTVYDIKAAALGNCILNTSTQNIDLILGHLVQTDATKKSVISKFGAAAKSDITSTAISSYWISKWLDAGDPLRNKRLLRSVIVADQEGTESDTYSLTWELREDWKDTAFSGVNGAMSGTVYLTGSSTTLSGETVESNRTGNPMEIRVDMSRTLRTYQLKLLNDTAAHPWTVHKITFEGTQKGKTKVT